MKKNKMLTISRIVLILLPILVIKLGCSSDDETEISQIINRNRIPDDISHLNLKTQFIDEGSPYSGVSLAVLGAYNADLTELGHLRLETPQDEIVVSVVNSFYQDVPIILKIFYNYEEVSFQVTGMGYYDTEFLFNLESGYQINIPFQLYDNLENNYDLNVLTIGVFEHPEQLTKNADPFTFNTGFGSIFNFSVSYGGENEIVLSAPYQELPNQIENIFFRGVMINQYSAEHTIENSDGGVFSMPMEALQVSSGESIEFYFYANAVISLDVDEPIIDYLIISMLDWQQIPKDGQPHLLVEARYDDMHNDIIDHGRFTVIMPEEPGFYELVTFIVPNPTTFNENIVGFPFELGFPFTIEVVE